MSGHSKWANIRLRKAAQDARKGKLYGKLTREIIVAAREGGGSPESNSRLKNAIQKAREFGLPQDNIKRAIQRGTGEIAGAALEEVSYEGYGPGGVALLIQTLTENRNRTVGEIRSLLARHGGNLGAAGCVSWMFEKRGVIIVRREQAEEEMLMEAALEAGAEDIIADEGSYEIITAPQEVERVREALQRRGIIAESAEATLVPSQKVLVEGSEAQRVLKLMEALEEQEDVQQVYSNFDISEKVLEAAAAGS